MPSLDGPPCLLCSKSGVHLRLAWEPRSNGDTRFAICTQLVFMYKRQNLYFVAMVQGLSLFGSLLGLNVKTSPVPPASRTSF